MRIDNSLKNIAVGVLSQVVIVLLGFVSRKVFIDSLGLEYLGVNGLLTNVLSMFALIESGIGASIVYCLYKPLADQDRDKIIALVQLFKRAYFILALIVLGVSMAIYPFLGRLMTQSASIEHVEIIFLLFVAKNMLSFMNAHKWSLIQADQKGYVIARVDIVFQIVTTIMKIAVLLVTHDFIVYLLLEFILFAIQTAVNGRIVNKRYPYIRTKRKFVLDHDVLDRIKQNVKALFLHNTGGFLVNGVDNILISSFIGMATVGLYANYTMITSQLAALLRPLLGGVGASVGNMIATESNDKSYQVFQVMYLVNVLIYGSAVIVLYNVLQPFIIWWLGEQYVFGYPVLLLCLINFYMNGMRISITTFKTKAGLFVQDKYIVLIQGILNLALSFALVSRFGLAGILAGTLFSTLLTVFWTQPNIVYRHLFHRPVRTYYVQYFCSGIATAILCELTSRVNSLLFDGAGLTALMGRGVICVVMTAFAAQLLLHKNEQYKYLISMLRIRVFKTMSNRIQQIYAKGLSK